MNTRPVGLKVSFTGRKWALENGAVRVKGCRLGNKIKSLFQGAKLLAFGAGFCAGFAAGLVPAVRMQADKALASMGVTK